jgi:small-conductance mechanosensitive channel
MTSVKGSPENVIIFAVTVFAALAIYIGVFKILIKRAVTHKRFLPQLLQQYIYLPGLLLISVFVCAAAFGLLHRYLPDGLFGYIRHGLTIATICAFGFLILRSLNVFRELAYHRYKEEAAGSVSYRKVRTQFQLIQRIANVVIIIAVTFAVLITFPKVRELGTGLLASAGVVGIILGFAAQKSLGTLFGGIQIVISQPIRIGDVVVVEDEFGEIGEINLTFVTLKTWDGRRLIIPINYFLENSFENWTREAPDVVGKVKLKVDYTVPVEELRSYFMELIQQSPLWDKRAAGFVVTGSDDTTMEVRATMSAKDSGDAWDMECMVREKMIAFIQKNYPDALPKRRLVVQQPGQSV